MHSLTNHEGQGYHELTAVPAMAYCNRETTAWRNIRSSVWLHLRPWRCVSALKGITSSAERGQALSKPTLATLLSQNENKQYSKVGWNHLSLLVGYAWKYSRLFRCRCSKESGGGEWQLYFPRCHEKQSGHVCWESCSFQQIHSCIAANILLFFGLCQCRVQLFTYLQGCHVFKRLG